MDFITHLPPTTGKSVIWVIVDRLSKYSHFIALPAQFSAVTLAPIFISEIYRLHGMPKSIVSDRERVFVSQFWKELFRLHGTKLAFISAYHPQSDGQTEVTNRILETYLRCFVCDSPQLWVRYLPLAEYWCNSTFQSTIKLTPFEVLYGRPPPNLRAYVAGTTAVASMDESLTRRRQTLSLIRENLKLAQLRIKSQADAHRSDRVFKEGDWVWLKLQPFRQISLRGRRTPKLARRYFGPYQVLRTIGKVAYELALPAGARIHPVVHVSKLKPFYGTPPPSIPPLAPSLTGTRLEVKPHRFLGTRVLVTSDGHQQQFLVQWKGTTEAEAAWEDKNSLELTYPDLNLEDKVVIGEWGNDTNMGHSSTNAKQPKEFQP